MKSSIANLKEYEESRALTRNDYIKERKIFFVKLLNTKTVGHMRNIFEIFVNTNHME